MRAELLRLGAAMDHEIDGLMHVVVPETYKKWLRHYHKHRPHRGVGRDNSVLDENFVPKTEGQGRSRTELGGIIREYYRDAA